MTLSFAFIRRAALITALITIPLLLAAPSARAQGLVEDFDDVSALVGKGFTFLNNSAAPPAEGGEWVQGNPLVFESFTGAPNSYIEADFTSVDNAEPGTISNWMLTPTLMLTNGESLSFYTRTATGAFPDRLEVRLSQNGDSADVGATAESVGDFTSALLTINPDLLPAPDPNGYPTDWTRFDIALSGLPDAGATGRIGFRYFVTDAGAAGNNSDYIGIDSLRIGSVATAAPEPSSFALWGGLPVIGVLGGAGKRRFRRFADRRG